MYTRLNPATRRGAVVPFTAILLTVLAACVALAVDLGYMMVVRGQMQNAADAAALAGASQLLDPAILQGTPNSTTLENVLTKARTEAQSFASQNKGGNVPLTLSPNATNSSTGDMVIGSFVNPSVYSNALMVTELGAGVAPNAMQVRVRRDATRNGSLALFFAPAIGTRFVDMQVSATACYEAGIRGFRFTTPGSTNCKLLPYALDVNTWNSVVNGTGADLFTRNATTGAVTSGADGVKETKLFPLSNNGSSGGNGNGKKGGGGGTSLPPGNFGTVDLGAANNSTSDLARQILNGPNAADLAHFPNSRIELNPQTGTLLLNGDTGISAGVKDELASIIGQPRIIPLYSQVSGNGNNAQYTIVGFAGITITEVDLTGSLATKHITIQPCHCIDGTAIGGGSSSTSTYIYKPLALIR